MNRFLFATILGIFIWAPPASTQVPLKAPAFWGSADEGHAWMFNLVAPFERIASSPTGKSVAVSSGNKIGFIGVANPLSPVFAGQLSHGPASAKITSIGFSQDGRLFTSVSGGTIKVYQTATRNESLFEDKEHQAICASISPDNKLMATGGEDGKVKIWDLETKKAVQILQGVKGKVSCITFSSQRSATAPYLLAAAAGTIGDAGDIRVWGSEAWKERAAFKGRLTVSLHFTPDGMKLVSSGLGAPAIWDLSLQNEPVDLPGLPANSKELFHSAMSFDGKTLAIPFQSSLRLWDLGKESEIGVLGLTAEFKNGGFGSQPSNIPVAFSKNGAFVFTGMPYNYSFFVWDTSKLKSTGKTPPK